MQLLICPGYHPPALTHDFLQSLLAHLTPARSLDLSPDCSSGRSPERLWVLPIGASPLGLPWLLSSPQAPQLTQPLSVIAFSAGVVAAYPLLMAWKGLGGTGRLIAVDGWGMPLQETWPFIASATTIGPIAQPTCRHLRKVGGISTVNPQWII